MKLGIFSTVFTRDGFESVLDAVVESGLEDPVPHELRRDRADSRGDSERSV